MGSSATDQSAEIEALLKRAVSGDQASMGLLFDRHRDRLRRMVTLRLDQRLQGRIDASDVIQEAFLDAAAGLAGYMQNPVLPFYLWLRFLTGIRLAKLHRHHLKTQMRDAAREISIYRGALPETSSAALAAQLMGHETHPSEAAMRAELRLRLQDAFNSMDPLDREVLALRHFEQLSSAEAAQVLGIKAPAERQRYVRALERLREILIDFPGGIGEIRP